MAFLRRSQGVGAGMVILLVQGPHTKSHQRGPRPTPRSGHCHGHCLFLTLCLRWRRRASGTTTSVSLQILVDGYRVTVLQLGGQSGKTGQLGSQAQVPLAEPFNDMTCVVSSLRLSARLE